MPTPDNATTPKDWRTAHHELRGDLAALARAVFHRPTADFYWGRAIVALVLVVMAFSFGWIVGEQKSASARLSQPSAPIAVAAPPAPPAIARYLPIPAGPGIVYIPGVVTIVTVGGSQ